MGPESFPNYYKTPCDFFFYLKCRRIFRIAGQKSNHGLKGLKQQYPSCYQLLLSALWFGFKCQMGVSLLGAYRAFNCDGCPCRFCAVFVCLFSQYGISCRRKAEVFVRILMGRAATGLRTGEGGLSFWGLVEERSVFSQKNKTAGLLLS